MTWKSSKTSAIRTLPPTVTVALIRRPHGVRGAVVVAPLSDVPGRLAAGSELELVASDGTRRPVRVAEARRHQKVLLVRFAGVESRDEAEALRGARLEVGRERTPPPAPGSYYFFELEGCVCRDARQGELGSVIEVVEDGGGLLLRVEGGHGEVLVPFVHAFIRAVDIEAGTIDVDLPAGLVEACAFRS